MEAQLVVVSPIGNKHAEIASEFLERIKALLDSKPKIKKYAVEESYHTTETLELKIDDKTKLQIQLVFDT